MKNKVFKLYLYRHAKKATYTIGKLYRSVELADGTLAYVYVCDTLEDKDRGLNQLLPLETNKKLKVYGKTAIPMGEYELSIHHWSKYNVDVPMINNVPAFTGILMHFGNDENDTEGCPLVGENKVVGKVLNSRAWCTKVTNIVKKALKTFIHTRIIVTDIPPKNIITESEEKAIKKNSV